MTENLMILHNTLTDGYTWESGKVARKFVEACSSVFRKFMPEVYCWMTQNMDQTVEKAVWKNVDIIKEVLSH